MSNPSNILIGASILSADFSQIGAEVKKVEKAGIDFIHIDIMDGHFVPNITLGPKIVKDLRKKTSLILDSHLMIEEPLKFLKEFIEAGSDWITLHIEVLNTLKFKKAVSLIKRHKRKIGLSLNPETPLQKLFPYFRDIGFVLIMSVHPGFGGQKFLKNSLNKIKKLRKIFTKDIAVDGGVNEKTASSIIKAGANILCSGSYIFGSKNYKESIRRLRECAR